MGFYDLYKLNVVISHDRKLIFFPPKMSNYSTAKTVANHEKLSLFSELTTSNCFVSFLGTKNPAGQFTSNF